MSTIRLYIDEDSMDRGLIQSLRARNIDLITVQETKTEGRLDEEQLNLAASENRVIYSHNISDFCQLHTSFLAEGKSHSGIALLSQDCSIGEQLRAISGLVATKTAEEMQNQLEFLSKYLRNS